MKLKNKIILVTGGSSGFGLELTREFLKKEAKVIICSNQILNLKKAKDELKSKNLIVRKCDVRNYEEIQTLISELKKVDILVNCAGFYARGSFVSFSPRIVVEMLDVNLKGLMFFTHAILPKMIKRNKGIIINVGSLTGLKGKAYQTVYAASKFGVRGFTESLTEELSKTKIKIIEVYPGPMNTPIYQKAGISNLNYRRMDPKMVAQLLTFSLENSSMEFINNIVINGLRENFNELNQSNYMLPKKIVQQPPIDNFLIFNKAWREGKIKKPVIILIGGHIGTGKTTFAEEIKERLPYASLLTTAIIRSILQSLIPETQAPELYKHTYDLAQLEDSNLSVEERLIKGYETQAKVIDKGLRKLISFFESEGQLSIVEGNHILPRTTKELSRHNNIISLFFECPDTKIYRQTVSGLTHRRKISPTKFRTIRTLHDYIVREARAQGQAIFKLGDTKAASNYIEKKLIELIINP